MLHPAITSCLLCESTGRRAIASFLTTTKYTKRGQANTDAAHRPTRHGICERCIKPLWLCTEIYNSPVFADMPSFFHSAAILATASLALAAPTSSITKKLNGSVPRIRTSHTNKAAIAHYHTYTKYNRPAPEHVQKAAAADAGTGSVSATAEQYDSEYICPVTVGNNQLNLDFDTGSSDL